ncbi:MAG: hypothetical protein U9P82_08710 [Bacteroidota bacterium]|nr:hypothetical protein [Bacteroidota bacterium]
MKNLTKNLFRVLFLALISMSLFMTSCEDDDDVDPIVGTWALDKVEAMSMTFTPEQMGMSITIIMNEDGTLSGNYSDDTGTESISGTWERIDSETVKIYDNSDTLTLKKEGEYYTITEQDYIGDTLITMKMFFKKQ